MPSRTTTWRESITVEFVRGALAVAMFGILGGVGAVRVAADDQRNNTIAARVRLYPRTVDTAEASELRGEAVVAEDEIRSGIAFGAVLGKYETRYPSRKPQHHPRAANITLATRSIDGIILEPGETFSFNNIVGPRTVRRGYRQAPIVVRGELTDGIGGGTCQVASTLHAAAKRADLEILDRSAHSRRSVYIPRNLEAAVAYPLVDLKFKNVHARPVMIRASARRSRLMVSIIELL